MRAVRVCREEPWGGDGDVLDPLALLLGAGERVRRSETGEHLDVVHAGPGLQLLQQVPAAAAAAAAQGSGGGFKWEWVSVEGGGNASEEVRAPFKFVALVAADDFTKKS